MSVLSRHRLVSHGKCSHWCVCLCVCVSGGGGGCVLESWEAEDADESEGSRTAGDARIRRHRPRSFSSASLLVFLRHIHILKIPNCLYNQLTFSSNIHSYPTRHATRGHFTVPKSRTQSKQRTVIYQAMIAWNSLKHRIKQALKNKWSNT